jgi:hypothetical protein
MRGRVFIMAALFERKPKQIPISELFPHIPEDQQQAVGEMLDAYCELLFRIFERLENERRRHFDDMDSTA